MGMSNNPRLSRMPVFSSGPSPKCLLIKNLSDSFSDINISYNSKKLQDQFVKLFEYVDKIFETEDIDKRLFMLEYLDKCKRELIFQCKVERYGVAEDLLS